MTTQKTAIQYILSFVFILILTGTNYGQSTEDHLLIQSKKTTKIHEGQKLKVKLNDKQKLKGEVKFLNDSTLVIDETEVRLSSISSIHIPSKTNQTIGVAIAGLGLGITTVGTLTLVQAFSYSANDEDPLVLDVNNFITFILGVLGAAIVTTGGFMTAVGIMTTFVGKHYNLANGKYQVKIVQTPSTTS